MRFIHFLLFISTISFSQTQIFSIKDVMSCQNTPVIVDSGLNTLTTSFNCGEQIKLGTVRVQDVFPWCNPGFTIDVLNTNFFPSPSRSVKIYKNNVLWIDIPYTQVNQPLPNTGGYLDPTAVYRYEICDYANGGSFAYTAYDVTDEYVMSSGTFDIPAGGGCASIEFGPIGGTYTFSGAGITNLGNGTALFNSSVAGVGTHDITYTFTNARGCTGTDTVQLTVNGPSVDAGTDIFACKGEQVTIGTSSVVNGGSGTVIYNWTSSISGNTNNSQNFTATVDTTETYYLNVTDVNGAGCTVIDSIKVTAFELPQVELLPNNFEVCAGDSTLITANYNNGSGTINYAVLSGDTALLSNYGTNNAIFSASQSGNYQINMLVSDDNACSATTSTYITVNENPIIKINEIENVKCYGDSTAYINFTSDFGQQPFTYFLNTDSNQTGVFDSLQINTYNLAIVDNNLCKSDTQISIIQPDSLSINVNTISEICGNSNGSISVSVGGGSPSYSYTWNNVSQDTNNITGLSAGIYYLTVTDSNLCDKQTEIIVNGSGKLSVKLDSVLNVVCNGDENAKIYTSVLVGANAYTSYLYRDSLLVDSIITTDTTISFVNLNIGSYSVIVIDTNNCIDTLENIYISEPNKLELYYSEIDDVTCFGGINGSISAEIQGGSIPYTFYWNNVLGSENLNYAKAGTYILRTKDNNSCIRTDTFVVAQPTQLQVSDTLIMKNNLGSIMLNVNGGTPEYYYNWSNGETLATNNDLISGKYTVTITDKNECSVEKEFVIELPLIIPNVITPNADGYNDRWKIQNIEAYGDIKITILNRWGDVLFTYSGNAYSDEANQWDGVYMGQELPFGTYLYLLKLSDTDVRKGTITIVR